MLGKPHSLRAHDYMPFEELFQDLAQRGFTEDGF